MEKAGELVNYGYEGLSGMRYGGTSPIQNH